MVIDEFQEARQLLKKAEAIYQSVPVRDRYYLYFVQVVSAAEIEEGEFDRPEHRLWETLVLARSDHSRGKNLRLLALILAKRYGQQPSLEARKEVISSFEEALATLEKVDAPTERMLCFLDYRDFLKEIGEQKQAKELEELANGLALSLNINLSDTSLVRDSRISIPENNTS